MRPSQPFNIQHQPVGMYAGNLPQMYMQPILHHNAQPPANFTPIPHVPTTYSGPQYLIQPGQHQVPQQYNDKQIKIAKPQFQQPPVQIQTQKQAVTNVNANVNVNQQNALQTFQNENAYKQNQGQQYENYQEGYEGQEYQQIKNQQIIMFWQHKFYTILERFQLIFEKVETFRIDFQHLNQQLRAVDSEQQWNQAKQHHQDYMEQLQQFTQQLAGVINENANLVEQTQHDTNDQLIWKDRYFQLFEGYKAMEQQLFQMKENNRGAQVADPKMAQLMNNYRELQRQYTQTVNQLSQLKQNKQRAQHDNSQDKSYRQKLDYALRQAQKYKEMLEQLSKQNQQLDSMISDLKNQKHQMQQMMQNNSQRALQHNFEQYNRAIQQRDQQISILNKQLQQLSDKYNFLVETHNNLQARVQDDQPRIKGKFNELELLLDSKNKQVNELKKKVYQIQLKQKTVLSSSQQYQRQLRQKSNQLQQRNDQIQKLKREIINAVNSTKTSSDNEINVLRKDYEGKTKKIQAEFEQKITQLKKKLRKKQQETQNVALMNIKIQSLEKKNKMLLQQIQNLNKQLGVKEKQSIEFKRISFSQDKIKQLQYQYNLVLQQKQHLNSALLQKNYQMDSLQSQIQQFETRIKELGDKSYNSSSKPLLAQIEELNNLVQIKENDINKLKANNGLKENQIRQLENQINKVKSTLISNQKHYQRQKQALNESIKSSERRNQQNQKKMRDLQFEFGSIMKKNLQDQIKNLRSQNQARQENIIRLEAEELELRGRISHYQRVRATHSGDVDELNTRIRQLQNSKSDMIKKVQTSFREVKKKEKENKQLVESAKQLKDNIIKLQTQIVQNQKLIKQKDKVIENLEGQLLVNNSRLTYITEQHDNLRLRRRDQTDMLIKQSDQLRRKLFEYEHLSSSKKQLKDQFSGDFAKIQNNMIQQLREQKQFLKNQLSIALQKLGQIPNFDGKKSEVKKSRASEGIDYIQKRLFQFNGRLDQMIAKNKQLNSKFSFGSFGNNIENWSASKTAQNRDGQQVIKSLKSQIQQLRKYIAKLQVETAGQTIRYNPKNQVIAMQHEKVNNQRIQFYQKQTAELENRIQNLIKVNTSLKERLDSLLKGDTSNSATSFYKQQLAISEETSQNLNNKIKKLIEQNRTLKSNSSDTTTKMCRQYEDKIFQCEHKIFILQRKANTIQFEKTKSENEKAGLQKSLQLVQTQLYNLKSSSQKQLQSNQKNSKQLSQQLVTYQNQINQLLGKIRVLQSENSRLSQAMYSPYSQQQILLNTPVKGTPAKGLLK